MRDAILLFALFASAWLGFLLLALSQPHHWKLVLGQPGRRPPAQPFRIAASLLLAASLALALLRDGPAFGAILWVVMLTIAGTAAVATLTWQKPMLRTALRLAGALDVVSPAGRHNPH